VGPRAGLDAVVKFKDPCPTAISIKFTLHIQCIRVSKKVTEFFKFLAL